MTYFYKKRAKHLLDHHYGNHNNHNQDARKIYITRCLRTLRYAYLCFRLPLPLVALTGGSCSPLRSESSKRALARSPLLSASTYVPVIMTVTGFTYSELAPHKITSMPDVHKKKSGQRKKRAADYSVNRLMKNHLQ